MPDEKHVLVLQGGGALGAYQAGAYEGLVEFGIEPEWIAGISIGAINAALIAGNPPGRRVARLREFWELVSSTLQGQPWWPGSDVRTVFNEISATLVATTGVPGFFTPRVPPGFLMPRGSPEATSLYDSSPLRETLLRLVDFALINAGTTRLSVGAVNVTTGNFTYFDNTERELRPEHVMASGALPPGLPSIAIDGEHYWDGGLVSNTPLQYVLDWSGARDDMCVFQVDLFSARGDLPQTLGEVMEREQDIRYSSRTRLSTDSFRERQILRSAARRLCEKLPPSLQSDPDALALQADACGAAVTIVQLINRAATHESRSKDHEFSRVSVEEHWQAGLTDVRRSLRHPDWRKRVRSREGVVTLDLTRD